MPHPDCKPNDPGIKNDEVLLRRISPNHIDGERVSYEAFNDKFCSVEVKSRTTPKQCLANFYREGFLRKNSEKFYKKLITKAWRVDAVVTQTPRDNDQTVYFQPEVSYNNRIFLNEAHAEICGEKSKVILRKLADNTKIA